MFALLALSKVTIQLLFVIVGVQPLWERDIDVSQLFKFLKIHLLLLFKSTQLTLPAFYYFYTRKGFLSVRLVRQEVDVSEQFGVKPAQGFIRIEFRCTLAFHFIENYKHRASIIIYRPSQY